ncbi:MFS transporter [Acetobacterium wieringae]|uniref:Major facilitator superfamily protein n=1 Tax=Acetobacterium wieringae TaxID=52694 RepID=A0A1F2PED3_9FIRM|nr:MFS transporter [Acetobacterium wieringae]OFV69767.1 major facilitator superfamily protein [Acetobacterium wieringae]
MEKKRIKIAILSISSLLMISMTASAILADIQAYFVGVDPSLISMVLTIPALMGLVFAFASGPLSLRLPKKSLVIFGLVCGLAGGMIALLFGSTSIYVLLACSLLLGIAQGMNSTMSMALIADYFVAEESGALMGLQSAFVNGGSMVLLFSSGMLAGISWQMSYLVYLVFIPVIVIVIKNLPRDHAPAHAADTLQEKSARLNGRVYFTALTMFLFGVFLFVFQTNVAMFVVGNGLGDASTSGLINTAMSAAGMLTGILFGRMQQVLKKLVIPVSLLVGGLGMLLIFMLGSLPSLFIGAMCCGFCLATINPAGTFQAANAVHPSISSLAIAVVTASTSVGIFVSPILSNGVANLTGGGIEIKFLLAAVGLAAVGLMSFVGNAIMDKKEA